MIVYTLSGPERLRSGPAVEGSALTMSPSSCREGDGSRRCGPRPTRLCRPGRQERYGIGMVSAIAAIFEAQSGSDA